ncbi:MAG: gluconolactonase [Pirellulaceae bacterium]|jgi:gluconolactonase
MQRMLLTILSIVLASPFSNAADKIPPRVTIGTAKLVLPKGAGEGPAWDTKLGLLFSGAGNINRLDREGTLRIYREGAGTNGLLFDSKGRLLACEPGQRRFTRTENGKVTVLAERFAGHRFNQPNDLAVDSTGRIYFSDPKYGPRTDIEMVDENGRQVEGVYCIHLDGKVTRVITHEADRPNGLLVTPDDKFLYVADNNNNDIGAARKLWRFKRNADASLDLKSKELIYDWGDSRGPDGMAMDTAGNLYVAGGLNKPNPPAETNKKAGGIYIFDPQGALFEFVAIPRDEVTNCSFGDDDLKTLYITAGGTLWSIRSKFSGRLAWPVAGK